MITLQITLLFHYYCLPFADEERSAKVSGWRILSFSAESEDLEERLGDEARVGSGPDPGGPESRCLPSPILKKPLLPKGAGVGSKKEGRSPSGHGPPDFPEVTQIWSLLDLPGP